MTFYILLDFLFNPITTISVSKSFCFIKSYKTLQATTQFYFGVIFYRFLPMTIWCVKSYHFNTMLHKTYSNQNETKKRVATIVFSLLTNKSFDKQLVTSFFVGRQHNEASTKII